MGLFAGLHTQSVTVESWAGRAGTGWQGTNTYGAAVPYDCRIERRQQRVIGPDMKEKLSQGRVIIEGTVAVDVEDRLTLPAGNDPTTPPILAVGQDPDPFNLIPCTVIYF